MILIAEVWPGQPSKGAFPGCLPRQARLLALPGRARRTKPPRVSSSSVRTTELERKGSMETASVPVMDLCSETASEERPPKRVRRMLAPSVGSSPCWAAPPPTLRGHGACRASVQALLSLLQLLRCAARSTAQPQRSPLASPREHARQSAQRHTPVPHCARCTASRGLSCWPGCYFARVL
jgi:hypothetical protein